MRAAGSAPGVAKKIRKTTMLIPSMTKSIWKKRRISRLSMGSSDSELGPRIERVTHPVAQHELALLQGQDLAPHRPRHIRNVDDADDGNRQPQAAGGDRYRPDIDAVGDQHDGERNGQEEDRKGPDDVQQARD